MREGGREGWVRGRTTEEGGDVVNVGAGGEVVVEGLDGGTEGGVREGGDVIDVGAGG